MSNIKKSIMIMITGMLLGFAVKAQPEWVRIYDPPNAVFNLKPYYYFNPARSAGLTAMQKDISDATVSLSLPVPINFYNFSNTQGTGFFIRTPTDSPFICLLTAAHGIMEANSIAPSTFTFSNIGFRYRRTATENWGDNFTKNIEYHNVNTVTCKVLDAKYELIDNFPAKDYALIAYPKAVMEKGLEIYEAPYDFPVNLTVPNTPDEELFMIHHPHGMPQRLSELSNDYPDVAQNHHQIGGYLSPGEDLWRTKYWLNGSISFGSSGAALIRPVYGQPRVVGVQVAAGSKSPTMYDIDPSTAIQNAESKDTGRATAIIYKLHPIADVIRRKCGCSDAVALTGIRVTPGSGITTNNNLSLKTQAVFKLASVAIVTTLIGVGTTAGAIYYCTNVGNIHLTMAFSNIHADIHAQQGDVILESGFDAQATNGVELNIGLITANTTSSSTITKTRQSSLSFNNIADKKTGDTSDKIQPAFKIYPSPTRGIVNITPELFTKAYTLRITDILGNEVFKENTAAAGSRQVNISSKITAGGIYLLQVMVDGYAKPVVWKIVVVK